MSNIISSLGAGSGIDVTNLITSLVEVERSPVESRLDTREAKLDAQISAYGALKSALSDFQSLVSITADNDTFNARSVAFPDTDILTPNSISAGAQVGSYQIEVQKVAKAQSLVLETADNKDTSLGLSGNLTFEFGDWTYSGVDADIPDTFTVKSEKDALTIEIDTSDSLSSIVQKLNEADVGVTASVLKIGDQYQLVVNMPSGASNAVRITSDNSASLGVLEFNETTYTDVLETQQASDALVVVNGLSVTRESNKLDDVIEGFDFNLNREAEGELISFNVEADTAIAEQAIRDLVEGFNLFVTTAKGITGSSRDEENNLIKGDLSTDTVAKSLVSRIRETMNSAVDGVQGTFSALASIGIRTNLDGSLAIDEKTFSTALTNNFADIEALFAPTAKSASTRVQVGQGSQISKTETGAYEVEITQDATQGSLTGGTIAGFDTSSGDFTLKLSIDGVSSNTLTLNTAYASAAAMASDLEALINADSNLSEQGQKVDVSVTADNKLEIVSRRYGSASTVEITAVGADMGTLGLSVGSGTEGLDVVGTINGEAGFGAGRVLLPSIDSPAYGLTFTALEGAASVDPFTVNFSRGVAGGLTSLIERFLGAGGPVAAREDSIETQFDRIDDEREKLDRRIEAYEARLTSQFIAMERIISSLNASGSSLEGLADRLAFTAQRN